MNTLGYSHYLLGQRDKYEPAEALYRRMLETCRRTRNDDDELTLDAMCGLASILGRWAQLEDAATDLAAILRRRAQLDEAAKLQQHVLDVRRRTKGPEDPETLTALNNQAIALMNLGKRRDAEPLLRKSSWPM
jgi:hypothetical protein